MAEPKKKKRKKSEAAKREERRFVPVLGTRSKMIYGAAAVSAAVLGAGVYGQFRTSFIEGADGPMKNASYILGAGALALAAIVLVFPEMPKPLYVGDAGVAVENAPDELERIYWCDVLELKLEEGFLVVRSEDTTVKASLEEHPQAAAWIVKEARERVPDVVAFKGDGEIPALDASAGEVRFVPELQIAGRHCADTGEAITFAPDARLCPQCLECYHKDHVPEECVTCGGSLAETIEGTALVRARLRDNRWAQVPSEQPRPAQQSPFALHESPLAAHAERAQVPSMQEVPAQQPADEAHVPPSSVQNGIEEHTPDMHDRPEQQSASSEHPSLAAWHDGDWHVPAWHERPPQHPLLVQSPPVAAHLGPSTGAVQWRVPPARTSQDRALVYVFSG